MRPITDHKRIVFGALCGALVTISIAVSPGYAQTEAGHPQYSDTTSTPDSYNGRIGLAASLDVRVGWHEPGYVANRLDTGGWDFQKRDSGVGFGVGAGIVFSKNILWFQGNYYSVEYTLNDSHDLLQSLLFGEIWFRRAIEPFPRHKWFKLIPGIGWGRCQYEVDYEYEDPKLESIGDPGDANYEPEPAYTGTILRTTDNMYSVGVLLEVRSKDKKNALILFSIGYEYRVAIFSNARAVSPSTRDFPYTFPMLGLFEEQTPEIRFSGHYITLSIGGLWWTVK